MKSFEEDFLSALNTEIERLKTENDSLIEQFRAIREICYSKDKLIKDLADALERKHLEDSESDCPHCQALTELIGRAREAAR